MAREGWPDDWPHGRPEVPIVTPVITEGVCDAWSPCHDPERITRAEENIRIRDLPWPARHQEAGNDSMLGCYVYTPHYRPVALAVCMPPHADLRYAMDVLMDCAPGVPEGLFNTMVPIHPQRVPGYLSVIRFPAHIRGVHDGYAAVICDLTRIGGAYFATILPKHLSHEALVQFLAPLVPPSDDPMRFFIGCRTKAWPLEALVTLRDGDAINVVRLHLPSLIADLGIALPAAFQETEPDDSVSMTDLSPVRDSPEMPPDPSERDGIADTPSQQHLDTTIPEGHGWNLGVDVGLGGASDNNRSPLATQPASSESPPAGSMAASTQSAPWTYAALCEHMAGAWDDAPPEAEEHRSTLEPSSAAPNVTYDGTGPAPSTDHALTRHVADQLPKGDQQHVQAPAGAAATKIVALILAPDYVPEYSRACVPLPCGVDHLIAQVAADRYGQLASQFPCLTPAVPQPYADFLLFVSSPAWLAARPIVILDCQRVLQTIFACMSFPTCTRESLLVAAGFRHDHDVSVFVHGLLQPLDFGQRIQLVTGMVISFAPAGAGAPATFDLATRLQSSDGWDPNPSLPGPGYFPGKTFWVLTDSSPTRFTLGYGYEPCLHAELCEHLGSEEHRVSLFLAENGIPDAFPKGQWITNVAVATEHISNVPFPPARAQDTGVALILDCRPLLLGIRWLLLDRPYIPVSEVISPFQEYCPAEYLVAVTGCATVQRDNDIVFPITSGQVLVISFTEDLQSSDQAEDPPDGPSDEHQDSQDQDGANNDTAPQPEVQAMPICTNLNPASAPRSRSRSPRGSEQADSSALAKITHPMGTQFEGSVYKWGSAHDLDALDEGMPSSTPVLTFTAARFRVVIPDALSATFDAMYNFGPRGQILPRQLGLQILADLDRDDNPVDHLLPSGMPANSRASGAYEAARLATVQLGLPWPMPEADPIPPVMIDEDSEEAATSEELTLINVTFLVSVPEYCPDSVTMQIAIPQTVAEAIELLDLCRSRAGREMFPELYPVHPQPDVRWGLAVAAPSWLSTRVILCLDLTLIDGRIFATVAPPELDKHILLNMAGLSGGAMVDVYLADQAEPVEYGTELLVANGDCISFVPAQNPLELRCPLQNMLRTHLGWADGPAFPQTHPGDRFCAVADGFYCDFLLLPVRAAFYRADRAARFQLSVHTLCIQPASPRQSDVTIYGRQCRTALCVGTSPRRNDDEVGLLDCRPILEGWSKVYTADRWLDVGALRHSLSLAAPEGYRVDFSGCMNIVRKKLIGQHLGSARYVITRLISNGWGEEWLQQRIVSS
ncbi:hypothetical protein AK812_SmicGene6142 [Symbiodinium microadriaticum]|uniref:Uncharacterized protein n=1 Tax=Symbiodinium microadriaticum TaxID=2951 RepID=A0A1Q9ES06_SYMMI|nr:hypothetical protein AK812_SmicGene6142 [Symbiodinium microadriaticum]